MNVRELEDAVWATEEIRIVIRANVNTQVGDYNYNKAAGTSLAHPSAN